jgi:hypothetical protein
MATEALEAQRLENKKKGLALGMADVPEYVFMNENGGPLDKDVWRRRVLNKAPEKAELRKIQIHDLRHTYATLRITQGDNIVDVSAQVGHQSAKLTVDVYYHWIPGRWMNLVNCCTQKPFIRTQKKKKDLSKMDKSLIFLGSPNGNRTRVFGVRGRYPRPLDDGTENGSTVLRTA